MYHSLESQYIEQCKLFIHMIHGDRELRILTAPQPLNSIIPNIPKGKRKQDSKLKVQVYLVGFSFALSQNWEVIGMVPTELSLSMM